MTIRRPADGGAPADAVIISDTGHPLPLVAGEYHLQLGAEGYVPLDLLIAIEPGSETFLEPTLLPDDPG